MTSTTRFAARTPAEIRTPPETDSRGRIISAGQTYSIMCSFEQGGSQHWRQGNGENFNPLTTVWIEDSFNYQPRQGDKLIINGGRTEEIHRVIRQDGSFLNEPDDFMIATR